MTHDLLNAMLRTVDVDTPTSFAIVDDFSPAAWRLRIFLTIASVSFWALFGLVTAARLCAEWALFSESVLQAKLVRLLSRFLPFKWLTVGRVGSGFKNARATSLWTNRISPKGTRRYPFCSWGVNSTNTCVTTWRTRPKSLTSYEGLESILFHFSIMFIRCVGAYSTTYLGE